MMSRETSENGISIESMDVQSWKVETMEWYWIKMKKKKCHNPMGGEQKWDYYVRWASF